MTPCEPPYAPERGGSSSLAPPGSFGAGVGWRQSVSGDGSARRAHHQGGQMEKSTPAMSTATQRRSARKSWRN